MTSKLIELTEDEREQVDELLGLRANEVAVFMGRHRQGSDTLPGCVDMALSREIRRLRALRDKFRDNLPAPTDDDS